jgi:molecular chaperone Hsp33
MRRIAPIEHSEIGYTALSPTHFRPMDASFMAQSDLLTRFLLAEAGIRGVHVRLESSWTELLSHASYPPNALERLGEVCAASTLFTGHTKVDGCLSIQLRTTQDAGLRSIFAECTAAGTVRGIVRLNGDEDAPQDLRELGADALLAITIENAGLDPDQPQRYQSLVALSAARFDQAFEAYFQQSEQLPTRLLLAADDSLAAGLLLQKLPGDTGDEDGWNRVNALFDTLDRSELLAISAESLLRRLFHQESLELLGGKNLAFGCSCSQERVDAVLRSLGEEEARAAIGSDGVAEVRCEFCGRRYYHSLAEILSLFKKTIPEALQSKTIQ